ncbi:alpha-2-macroglobulin-like protein 1 [Microcaecilia unicolor]|uniref:Alpha-2-macroglobulin-like protein 1 n=1 Tax=Microcaecilia unicolor TaxID=1415580 RepID=A0A6P7WRR9_9AMPH|nr:alpha-2-macroglobulin-like protein 1 [Microcaecilia unicolor]XP_030043083.1 alpha-2-macroglobulin-like protein 1 [Microcaecilia unicolor]
MLTRLFLAFFVLPVVSSLDLKVLHGVMFQAKLEYPSESKVCIHLRSPGTLLTLNITLQTEASNIQIYGALIEVVAESFNCISFQVPAPSGGIEEVATVTVKASTLTETFEESTLVVIQSKTARTRTLIQTDKPIYKGGQKVDFRIVKLNETFIASQDEYSIVELLDPNQNRIGQWQNVIPQSGIVQLSYQLASDPVLGTYGIKVGNNEAFKSFDVEQYVLPKFQTTLQLPSSITIQDSSFPASICGRYTYGQPVKGSAQFSVCQTAYKYYWSSENVQDKCQEYTGKTDVNGCLSVTVPTSAFNLTSYSYQSTLQAQGFLVEDGTAVQINASGASCYISNQLSILEFQDTGSYFSQGSAYTGKLKLKDAKGAPLPSMRVTFNVWANSNQLKTEYITDANGEVSFQLDTSSWNASYVSLQAQDKRGENYSYQWNTVTPYYGSAYASTQKFYATSNSSLSIHAVDGKVACGQNVEVTVQYDINENDVSPGATSVDFIFLVISKSLLNFSFSKTVPLYNENGKRLHGSFTQSFSVADLSPSFRALVYFLDNRGSVAVDIVRASVSSCFKNMVQVTFSEKQSLPGSEVNLQLNATPGSLCAVHAVDKSILLLRPETELTADYIYNMLVSYDYGQYPWNADDPNPCLGTTTSSPVSDSTTTTRSPDTDSTNTTSSPDTDSATTTTSLATETTSNDYYGWGWDWYRPSPYTVYKRDPRSVFKDMGIKILGNWDLKAPVECIYPKPQPYFYENMMFAGEAPMSTAAATAMVDETQAADGGYAKSTSQPKEQTRSNFPETFIFDLFPVGSSGNELVPVTVPDTITNWETSMFCTSDIGFGLSSPVTLTAYKPFFVESTIPYSLVRGESCPIKITVFNYQLSYMKIKVTLAKSADFRVEGCEDCSYTSCIAAEETITTTWLITPNTLGEINFTVSAEALSTTEQCYGQETVVPEEGQKDTIIKPLLVKPEGVTVEETRSAFLSVKESSATEVFSLNIPAEAVEGSARAKVSVVGDIMGTSLENIENLIQMSSGCGEQNMINFSPCVYAYNYLKSTNQLTPELEARASTFICAGYGTELKYKHSDGSYSAFGDSDSSGNTWLTAFVAGSFSEAKNSCIDQTVIDEAVTWLGQHQNSSGCFNNVGQLFHTTMKGGVEDDISLTCYVTMQLLKMGKTKTDPMVAKGLTCVDNALSKVSTVYTQALCGNTYALAGDVEKAQNLLTALKEKAIQSDGLIHWSYNTQTPQDEGYWAQPLSVDVELSAYVLHLCVLMPDADMSYYLLILRWMMKQQNSFGSYTSTQDTVVGLMALSKVGELIYAPSGKVTVSVSPAGATFNIDDSNRLLVQSASLTQLSGDYTVTVNGSGSVLVQMTQRYNIVPSQSPAVFNLTINIKKIDVNTGPEQYSMTFELSYTGNRESTNMVLLTVNMLSGFTPIRSTVEKLMENSVVKRTEVEDTRFTVYLDKLNQDTVTLAVYVERTIVVNDLKSALAILCDYYNPDESVTEEYNIPSQ